MASFVLIAVTWGLNYLFVRAGLALAAPLWLAFLRSGTGALAVSIAVFLRRPSHPRLDHRGRRDALLLGLPNTALFFGLWFLAAGAIPPGETAVLVYTFPVWVALLSGPLLGRTLGRVQIVGIVGGFLGVALVTLPSSLGSLALAPLPVAAVLVGAVSWAVGTVGLQRRFSSDELQEANAFQLVGGAAGLLAAGLVLEPGQFPSPSIPLLGIVLWLGLAGTAAAYAGWFYLLGRVPAPTLSAFTFLVPLVALGASAVIFGERLDYVQGAGVVLVTFSIFVVGWGARSFAPPAAGAGSPAEDRAERSGRER